MTVRVTTLPGGLRVVTDPMATVESASLGAWIGVGTRHERVEINGVSHLLEHMAFKGTERRTARAIAEEIEAVGGHLNAYTAREQTAYYAKVLRDDVPLAVDLIADILQHSVFDPEELERERTVIIQEIGQALDTPDDIVFDYFQETAYPGQALGRSVLGSVALVRDMPRETILGFMREHYGAPNVIVAAAGRVDHDRFVDMVEASFRALPPPRPIVAEPARYHGGDFRRARDLEQVHVLIGFEGIAYADPDFYAASVFSTLFGGGMSSRLFQEVREKRGLVYSIYSYLSCYTDNGLFGIYAGSGAREIAEVVPLIAEEFVRVGHDADEAEVVRACAQLKASILMAMESTSYRSEQAARHLLVFGRPLSVEEIVAGIDAVDVAAVRRVARRLRASRPTLSALGPIATLEEFDRVADRFRDAADSPRERETALAC
jgi:predicted Zn-dependent peptidase